MSALTDELLAALESPRGRKLLIECAREALRLEQTDDPVDLVDAKVAATILGITRNSVLRGAERGTIPCVRHGRRVRFRVGDLRRGGAK